MGQVAEKNSLKDQMHNVLEEARMILPGIQALFGFQTIAVFNQRFEDLDVWARSCHLAALILVVIAIGLVMAPASWHRLVSHECVTQELVALSSNLICAALWPLATAIALDVGVVIQLACETLPVSVAGASLTLIILAGLWFVEPMRRRHHGRASRTC